MPSTHYSRKPLDQQEHSSAGSLARRYRHLFVLPSKALLVIYAGILSLLLSLAAAAGTLNAFAFLSSFLVAIFLSAVVPSIAKVVDMDTIATFRRMTAVVFAGDAVWLFCLFCGLVYGSFAGGNHPLANALVFGAFVCAGFEFIIINGAFAKSTSLSLLLAALHPFLTSAVFKLTGAFGPFSIYAVPLGLVASVILVLFMVALRRHKTSKNYDPVHLFRAFMKTWVGGSAADLEEIILKHAEVTSTSTKVLRFQQDKGDIFIVLPGVHPGPFHLVGSYNLPGLVFNEFAGSGPVLTLHRPGGHERNLATNADTKHLVSDIHEFALSIRTAGTQAEVRGPVISKVGQATVSTIAITRDALLTISFAPMGSEDLDTEVEEELSNLSRSSGLELSLVDAHNSVEPRLGELDTQDPGWKDLFDRLSGSEAVGFRIAYANSHELGLGDRQDITDGGIGLLLLEVRGQKWALILADANNAAPSLRDSVAAVLEASGYRLLELCTSDSHNLAARGLTVNRGYKALGEATPTDEITKIVVELARIADSRLTTCRYGSGTLVRDMNTFGTNALDEFDEVTRSSIATAKHYSMFAAASTLVLLVMSLVL